MADNEDAPKDVASEEQPAAEEKPEEPTEGAKSTEDETGAEADNKDEDGFAAEVIKAVVNRQSISEPPSELQEEEKAAEEPPAEDEPEDQPPSADTEPAPTTKDDSGEKEATPQPPPTEAKPEAKPKAKPATEEMIVPHLLTEEEITAKGIAVPDVDDYRRFYLKQSFSPIKWYEAVKEHTFEAEFITLSKEEVNAILASFHPVSEEMPQVGERETQVLTELSDKIKTVLDKYEGNGAFIKLNKHSPKDSVLDGCDPDYKQAIQDAILTDLEIESQFANAYLTWRSWRSSSFRHADTSTRRGDNVLRRSFRRIQQNFRPRAQSAVERRRSGPGKSEGEPLEEVKKDEEENKEETTTPKEEGDKPTEEEPKPEGEAEKSEEGDKKEEEGEKKEEEGEKKEEEGDSEAAKPETKPEDEPKTADEATPIIVEATVEGGANNTDEGGATADDSDDKPAEAEPTPEATPKPEATPESEVEEVKEKKTDKKEVEIAEVDKPARNKPLSAINKREPSQEHIVIKVKNETLQNKVLRSFIRTINQGNRITSGEDALNLLTTSIRVKENLTQVKAFADVEGAEAVLCIRRWDETFAKYPGMVFRVFVYKNQLNGISQIHDVAYIPNIARYKSTIESKIEVFFNDHLKKALGETESYIVDLFIAPNKVYVVDLSPFHTSTGACLFTWQQNKRHLMAGPMEMKYIATPFKQCFTGLAPHWQQVCESVVQQKLSGEQSTRKCILL